MAALGFRGRCADGPRSPALAAEEEAAAVYQILKRVRAEAEALLAEADRQQEQARQTLQLREQKTASSTTAPGPPANRGALTLNNLNFPTLSPKPPSKEVCFCVPEVSRLARNPSQ